MANTPQPADSTGNDTGLSKEEWEALCDGCGACCRLAASSYACAGLDVETRRCSVYERRTGIYPCNRVTPDNIADLHRRKILPDTCGYVRWSQGLPPLDVTPVYKLVDFSEAPSKLKTTFYVQTLKLRKEKRFPLC